jgi:hypothetical protein
MDLEMCDDPHAKPWLRAFGILRDLRGETTRIDRVILEEFGHIKTEDCA